jgi:uncharacterized protein (TIGR03435 family)
MRYLHVAAVTLALFGLSASATNVLPGEWHFDTVSITRSPSSDPGMRRRTTAGREIFENASAQQLIVAAYAAEGQRLLNVPDWAKSGRYDIVATHRVGESGTPLDPARIRNMLQALLEERFALRAQQSPGLVVIEHIERPIEN